MQYIATIAYFPAKATLRYDVIFAKIPRLKTLLYDKISLTNFICQMFFDHVN